MLDDKPTLSLRYVCMRICKLFLHPFLPPSVCRPGMLVKLNDLSVIQVDHD
jgi:hypothetical protein